MWGLVISTQVEREQEAVQVRTARVHMYTLLVTSIFVVSLEAGWIILAQALVTIVYALPHSSLDG